MGCWACNPSTPEDHRLRTAWDTEQNTVSDEQKRIPSKNK
jgi:hypothetical protein